MGTPDSFSAFWDRLRGMLAIGAQQAADEDLATCAQETETEGMENR